MTSLNFASRCLDNIPGRFEGELGLRWVSVHLPLGTGPGPFCLRITYLITTNTSPPYHQSSTDLHDEIASLKAATETSLRDFVVPLQNKVQRLQQENVVLRWSCKTLVSASQGNETVQQLVGRQGYQGRERSHGYHGFKYCQTFRSLCLISTAGRLPKHKPRS